MSREDGICGDCGCSPIHEECLLEREDGPPSYCRSCTEKSGFARLFATQIDHDLLRAKVGRELAAEILASCRHPFL